MAKMFYTMDESKDKLGISENEILQKCREGRLREFRDGPRLMFKADQVEQLALEINQPTPSYKDIVLEEFDELPNSNLPTREEVYRAIDGIRDNQDVDDHNKSFDVTAELLRIQSLATKGITLAVSRPEERDGILWLVKEISTVGVRCLEKNGLPQRRKDG